MSIASHRDSFNVPVRQGQTLVEENRDDALFVQHRKLQVADGVKSETAFRDQFTATFTQTVLVAIYTRKRCCRTVD
jgi:hypothetical protein